MRIVRPYGRSFVDHDPGGALQRKIELRAPVSAEGGPRQLDLGHFALTHDELVIAQWVSCIDKIATKPREGREPSRDQREFRDRLGNAAWGHLVTNGLLSGFRDPQKTARLAKLWQMKIAPYDFPRKLEGHGSRKEPTRRRKGAGSACLRAMSRCKRSIAVRSSPEFMNISTRASIASARKRPFDPPD